MPDARVTEVCDALVAAIAAAWSPAGNDGIVRDYLPRVKAEGLTGRRAWVYPDGYSDDTETRGEDLTGYRVTIVVAERYPDAGDPARAWVDARVNFVEEKVYQTVANYGVHDTDYLVVGGHRRIWTETADLVVYDVDHLTTKKLFYSELELLLREIA